MDRHLVVNGNWWVLSHETLCLCRPCRDDAFDTGGAGGDVAVHEGGLRQSVKHPFVGAEAARGCARGAGYDCRLHRSGTGTENVAAIVGMAAALKANCTRMTRVGKRLDGLAERLRGELVAAFPDAVFPGAGTPRQLPGFVSVALPGRSGEGLVHILDLKGIAVSAGAACDSRNTQVSHVPYSYFGITLAGGKAHEGAIDDVRIVALAPTPQPVNYDDIDTHNFVWNPAVAAVDWHNAANWLYEGIAPALTYPSDASQDVVRFDSAATVSFPAAAAASNVTFNAAVTMQGGDVNRYGLTARLVDGTGTVTLASSGFANPLKSPMTNTVDIVMTSGTTNHFNAVGSANNDPGIYIKGNISGEGCYQINLAKVRMCNAYFFGNNNEFQGDVYTSGGKDNRSVINWTENAVGTNAFLHIGHSYGTYNSDSYRMGGSVKFGGVDGGWWDRYDTAMLTIGYLNRDSTINLSNGVSGRANSVTKVGTANLTLGTKTIKNLTVSEGSVTMPVGIAPQTLAIAEGAKILIPGDASWTAGTVTNLFSYTTLSGATSATLSRQVEVTGLRKGLKAKISVSDNTVKATIVKNGFVIVVL